VGASETLWAARECSVAVELISPDPCLVVPPRLYEADLYGVCVPLSVVLEPLGITHRRARVIKIDATSRTVRLDDGSDRLRYDQLVFAAGSHLPSPVGEHVHAADTYEQALAVDDRLVPQAVEGLLAAGRAGPEHVQADPGDDRRQPALEAVDLLGVGPLEPDPSLLHRVVGLVQRAEDPVGDRPQLGSLPVEPVGQLNFVHRCHTVLVSRVIRDKPVNPNQRDWRCQMARIEGVSKRKAGPMVKLIYRLGPRMMKRLTGREPQTGSGLEPMEIWAHQPKMMMGMGKFNQAVRKGKSVDERLKNLVEVCHVAARGRRCVVASPFFAAQLCS
jgi:hypothetical protein